MTDAADSQLADWQDGSVIDLGAQMMDLITRATVANLFGTDMPETARAAVAADLSTLIKGFLRRTIAPNWLTALPLPANRRHQATATRLRATLADIITAHRAHRSDGSRTGTTGEERHNLLDALLDSRTPSSHCDPAGSEPALSEEEITDQVVTFYGAGVESTAYILTWALTLIASHPDVQARGHDEVDHASSTALPPTNTSTTCPTWARSSPRPSGCTPRAGSSPAPPHTPPNSPAYSCLPEPLSASARTRSTVTTPTSPTPSASTPTAGPKHPTAPPTPSALAPANASATASPSPKQPPPSPPSPTPPA